MKKCVMAGLFALGAIAGTAAFPAISSAAAQPLYCQGAGYGDCDRWQDDCYGDGYCGGPRYGCRGARDCGGWQDCPAYEGDA